MTKRRAVDKSVENVDNKSAAKTAGGKPFASGHDPRRGRGPQKGAPNAGRPPNQFRELMRQAADRFAQALITHEVTSNPNHPYFVHAGKLAAAYAEGMPTQRVEVADMGIERKTVRLPPIAAPEQWPPKGEG